MSGKKPVTMTGKGNQAPTPEMESMLAPSANQPKKAGQIPPGPDIKPKETPVNVTTLPGIRFVA